MTTAQTNNLSDAVRRPVTDPGSAGTSTLRLLAKANISTALAAGQQARQVRTQRTADDTVHAIGCLAFSDIRQFYDEDGHLKPIHALPDDLAACVAFIEVSTGTSPVETGRPSSSARRFWDA